MDRITIKDHPQTDLNGEVRFKHPTIYTRISIERRAAELANLGRPPGSPKLTIADYDERQYGLILMLATLEHVIDTAPPGFYKKDTSGRPYLALGELDAYDLTESDGLCWQLYAAYTHWRSSFRGGRNRDDPNAPQGPHGTPDRPGGPQGQP